MLKPVGETGIVKMRSRLTQVPGELHCQSVLVQRRCFVNKGNYRGIELVKQVMKVLEPVKEGLIRQRVEINEM